MRNEHRDTERQNVSFCRQLTSIFVVFTFLRLEDELLVDVPALEIVDHMDEILSDLGRPGRGLPSSLCSLRGWGD